MWDLKETKNLVWTSESTYTIVNRLLYQIWSFCKLYIKVYSITPWWSLPARGSSLALYSDDYQHNNPWKLYWHFQSNFVMKDLTSFRISHFQSNRKTRTSDNSINLANTSPFADPRHDSSMFTFNAGNSPIFSSCFIVIENGKLCRFLKLSFLP